MRNLLFLLTFLCLTVSAQDTPNAHQAKRVFNTAWNHIYGQEGARFNYKINILGLYKEEGYSCNKGKKSVSGHKNTIIYDDGELKHIVRTNKKIVELHDPKVNKSDEKLQMFKFEPDSYNYSITKDPEGLLVTLEAKPDSKVKMKKIIALLSSGNYYPKRLRIKVSIFWATITFDNFQAGNIDDSILEFPKNKYSNYNIIDKR